MAERRRVFSGSPFEATVGYSRAVRVGDRVVVAGTAPQWPDGSVDPDPAVQARRCFEIIGVGAHRGRWWLVGSMWCARGCTSSTPDDFEPISRVHGELFADICPANTTLVVAALLEPGLEGRDRGRGRPQLTGPGWPDGRIPELFSVAATH